MMLHPPRPRSGRHRLAIGLFAAALAATACSSGSDGEPKADASDAAKVLGTKNPATGSVVKIGYVYDGVTSGITAGQDKETATAAINYVNDYLGGIAGHKIELVFCETKSTPAGSAACVSQMAKEKVPIALNAITAVGDSLFAPMSKAGVPMFILTSAVQASFTPPNIDIMINAISTLAGTAKVAANAGIKRQALVVIDVPAATGPIKQLAAIVDPKAGITSDFVTIPPGTPDVTPQITAELKKNPGQIVIVADKSLTVTVMKALAAADYKGKIFLTQGAVDSTNASQMTNVDGAQVLTVTNNDPTSPENKVYQAVLDAYGVKPAGNGKAGSVGNFQVVLGFARALADYKGDLTKDAIQTAIHAMKPQPFPVADGVIFQCNKMQASKGIAPNFCSTDAIVSTLDSKGEVKSSEAVKLDDVVKF